MYTHILISTDGSELAQRGVDDGLSLAKLLGSKVTVVTVTEPFPIAVMAGHGGWVAGDLDLERFEAGNKAFADRILFATRESAMKMGVEIDMVHVPDAFPASAIVSTAQKLGCNLIVMASHGRGGIRKVLLGSQTSEVLVTATVPVLVVH